MVLFVDLGHSTFSAAVVTFVQARPFSVYWNYSAEVCCNATTLFHACLNDCLVDGDDFTVLFRMTTVLFSAPFLVNDYDVS